MASAYQTVIWERLNKVGKWCPYSSEVCHLLEQSFQKKLSSVCLGDADSNLNAYSVNLKEFVQISGETGTKCMVRRRLCSEGSAAANQVIWEWRGDKRGAWHSYSPEIVDFIEAAYEDDENGVIDLSEKFSGYHYVIDFDKMMQKNKHTKYHRQIRRKSANPYPFQKTLNGHCEPNEAYSYDEDTQLYDFEAESSAASKEVKTSEGKKALAKQLSNLWKKITKSSDSENSANDHTNSSANKKLRKTKKTVNATLGDSNHVLNFLGTNANQDVHSSPATCQQYAIVNGKPWKYAWPPNTPQSEIRPVPGIDPLPGNGKMSKWKKDTDSEMPASVDVLSEFTREVSLPSGSAEDQTCIICYEDMHNPSSYDGDSTLVQLQLCSHIFHKSCVKAMYESGTKDHHLQCPTCKQIHGVKHGIQPEGKMTYHILPYSLPGHPDDDTIQIIYEITQGIQGPEHPNPGKRYSARGFPRSCYLPDSEIGRKILRLLVKAWERRLIFTIGSSSTTGETDTVTWNEIHHKTEFGFNKYGHGYPDPLYFQNVIEELAAHGVTESLYAWLPV